MVALIPVIALMLYLLWRQHEACWALELSVIYDSQQSAGILSQSWKLSSAKLILILSKELKYFLWWLDLWCI